MADIIFQSEKDNKENSGLLNSRENLPGTALSREAYLLAGGIKDGFLDRVQQAKEHPGLTALEFGGAVAVGATLTAMSVAGGRWENAAHVASRALTGLALVDGVRRAAPTLYAMGDTFSHPENYLQNRATVAKYLGSACFDYPIMAAGGMLGSAASFYGSRAVGSLSSHFRSGAEKAFSAPVSEVGQGLEADAGADAGAKASVEAARPEAARPRVNPADLRDKVIFWDENIQNQLKSPTSSFPFHQHDTSVKPYDFGKVPTLTEQFSIRSLVIPIVPLPLSSREQISKAYDK